MSRHFIVGTFLLCQTATIAVAAEKHTSPKTADVWEQVRAGMKMSWSTPVNSHDAISEKTEVVEAEIPEEKPKSNYLIEPHKAIAPTNNYTELGMRIRFGSDNPPEPKLAEVKKQELPASEIPKKDDSTISLNPRIQKHIDFFSQKPDYLRRVTERARPYLVGIVEELNKKQLPLELALLPIVESAYQPTAQSPKGAAGLWQFMPATGNDYGLKQNEENDERLDIQASTRAAIHFLTDLKTHYKGDWLLALAAYNCGQGAVDNAISKNVASKLKTDYWSLNLPKETQDYVPRLLALTHIFANPARYGLKFAPIKNEPYLIKAKLGENQG
jgi:hypothetical protein